MAADMGRGRLRFLVLSVLMAGCAAEPLPGPADSTRIVTLSGDLTEVVYALGAGDSLVGMDITTVYPPEAIGTPIVGLGRHITAEGVLAVNPTLVLADAQSGPLEALDQIRSAGVRVEILPVPTDFDELYHKFEIVGALLGRDERARELVDRVRSEVDSVQAQAVDSRPRIAYLYTRGVDVNLLFGAGMVSAVLIEAAGGIDAGEDAGVQGTISVTAESLVAAAPDVIIVPEEGYHIVGGIDELLKIPGVAETPAGRAGRIFAYPEGDFLNLGPRSAQSLRLLVADLAALGL